MERSKTRPLSIGDVVAVTQKSCDGQLYAELATVTALHDEHLWVRFGDDEEFDYLIPRGRVARI